MAPPGHAAAQPSPPRRSTKQAAAPVRAKDDRSSRLYAGIQRGSPAGTSEAKAVAARPGPSR